MKKTILATVIAATSFGAMAQDSITNPTLGGQTTDAQKAKVYNLMMKGSDTGYTAMVTKDGELVFLDENSNPITNPQEQLSKVYAESEYRVIRENNRDTRQAERGGKVIDEPTPIGKVREMPKQMKADVANKHLNGKSFEIGAGIDGAPATISGVVVNADGKVEALVTTTDFDGNEVVTAVEYQATGDHSDKIHARIGEELQNLPKIPDPIDGLPVEPTPTPPSVDPIEGEKPVHPTPQGTVVEYAQEAQAQTQSQIDELYAIGNQNASDIDTLFAEVDRLDTRIDQTQALNAATVNARPMVTNGMTAFGAGVGYAGSEAALAIGVAHSFEDTGWSASGTVAASSDDSVLGAGVQYAF